MDVRKAIEQGFRGARGMGACLRMPFVIESPAFPPDGQIPAAYTCEGGDISPPLQWSGVPPGTKSLALIVDDPDAPDPKAPQMTWVHWVLCDLPADDRDCRKVRPAAIAEGHARGTQRLETDWLRRPVPAHRPAPLFPQALRAGHGAPRTPASPTKASSRRP